ncbi:MAG: hypothetical protein M1829_004486 [Trizodia sp. TS-e1964]|nr:MAG: hypothetical protein M1829_004486 [Trizodia sp. TS-e1964]
MSLVPYSARDVVLRHNDAVVIFDQRSKQLALRNAQSSAVDLAKCPFCHRLLREQTQDQDRPHRAASPLVETSFVNPDYFRLLHSSAPTSATSGPPSPRRRLAQPTQPGIESISSNAPPRSARSFDENSNPRSAPHAHGISSSAFTPDYFHRFFVEERELGRGGKGVVLLVQHVLDGVELGHFACKRVPVGDNHEWLEKVLVEVRLLQKLTHQNLVSYQHVWLEDFKPNKFGPSIPCAFMLQQYCNGGDLHHYICRTGMQTASKEQLKNRMRRRSKGQPVLPQDLHANRQLNLEQIYSFFKDIASGLNHLHSNKYIHRDLKPSNCLLNDAGDGILRVLVSDFGEVQMENTVRSSTGATGTISYCAPEVLHKGPDGVYGNFTTKSDVFSLGMTLYFMCFGQLPYSSADNINEEKEDLALLRAEISAWPGFEDSMRVRPDLPEKLYTCLKSLLAFEPIHRPSAEEILHGISSGSNLGDGGFSHSTNGLFEELRSSSRISPIESPASSALPQGSHRRTPSSPNYNRPPSISRIKTLSLSKKAASAEEPQKRDHSPEKSSLILSPHRRTPPTGSSRASAPHIPPFVESRQLSFFKLFWVPMAARFLLFFLKILSLTKPCSPLAPNSFIFYPLLCIAAIDLLDTKALGAKTLILLAIHVLITPLAIWRNTLCLSPDVFWHTSLLM